MDHPVADPYKGSKSQDVSFGCGMARCCLFGVENKLAKGAFYGNLGIHHNSVGIGLRWITDLGYPLTLSFAFPFFTITVGIGSYST